jgi:deoxyadenosine/deoxycytidine kinase
MSRVILKWSLEKLVRNIVATLLNKYDFFIVIEGNTGTGKSTLAFHLASRVAQEFRKLYAFKEDALNYYYERVAKGSKLREEEFLLKIIKLKENKSYRFIPQEALIYTQKDLLKKLSEWNCISIPDELINITFNRDFYSEDQKNIVKMINMFRDHENLTLACVPSFQTIDTQIKNLTKMKITIKRRGLAIIHTQNKTVYCKDKWDSATNEKIEREWIMKKISNPNYSKLTTFRGLLRFPALTKKQEEMYQQIKNQKRNVVLKDEMHIDGRKEEKTIQEIVVERLKDGKIKNSDILDGIALANNISCRAFQEQIRRRLKKEGVADRLGDYYWDKKAKKEDKLQSIN